MTKLGLTKAEVEGVKTTWKLVEKDLDGHGVRIIQALFKHYPDYKSLFKTIKNSSEKDPVFFKHAQTFIKSLQEMVGKLEDKDELVKLLHANAKRHHARKVTITHYQNTLALVPGYLQDQLGPKLDKDAANGWQKVLDTMQAVIAAKIEELQKQTKGK